MDDADDFTRAVLGHGRPAPGEGAVEGVGDFLAVAKDLAPQGAHGRNVGGVGGTKPAGGQHGAASSFSVAMNFSRKMGW